MNVYNVVLLYILYLFIFMLFLVTVTPLVAFFSRHKRPDNHPASEKGYSKEEDLRLNMINTQIRARGIKNSLVIDAMCKVERHLFVPEHLIDSAYNDYPLPIGYGQTISQPYIVALMTELLELKGGEKILEIGTGSGYQTAILAQIASEVFSIEIIEELAVKTKKRLNTLGYSNIKLKIGDGHLGWPEHAPFDGIIITAAPDHVPQTLIEQLKVGGVLILPLGSYFQDLYRIKKFEKGTTQEKITSVRFVPMTSRESRIC